MLLRSQPLDSKFYKKICPSECREIEEMTDANIESQYIGDMFDGILDGDEKTKITLKLRIAWKWRDVKNIFHNAKYTLGNYVKWRKTVSNLRPWEGFDGLIGVMQSHLRNYVEYEEESGHSETEFRKSKVSSAKETIEILEHIKNPNEYLCKRYEKVKAKYPDYKYLITQYRTGGTSYSGDFVAYGTGWVGKEGGKNPREGYFEFIDGDFILSESPCQNETDRLLAELSRYYEEMENASRQAEVDSEKDFEQLHQLLKENLYSWWD